MQRPAFDDIFMELAVNLAKRSHCIKRHVERLYNGTMIGGSFTDSSGNYSIVAPAGFSLTLEIDNGFNTNLITSCPTGGNYTISKLPASGKNFGITCNQPGFDLSGNIWAWGIDQDRPPPFLSISGIWHALLHLVQSL